MAGDNFSLPFSYYEGQSPEGLWPCLFFGA